MPKSTIPAFFLSADPAMSLEGMGLCFTCIPRSLEELGLYLPCTPQMLWAMGALTAHLSQCCLMSEPPKEKAQVSQSYLATLVPFR